MRLHRARRLPCPSLLLMLMAACAQTPANTPIEPDSVAGSKARVDRDAVKDHVLSQPDPDPELMAEAVALQSPLVGGKTVIGYCIDVEGKTNDIEVIEAFPGSPMVAEVVSAAVAQWRYRPFFADGLPVEVCTTASFAVRMRTADGPPPR